MHTCHRCKFLRLSYPYDNIPTSVGTSVFNGAFDIARSVRRVLRCTLLRDLKFACNKHTVILHCNINIV